jgi:hypothetical protein
MMYNKVKVQYEIKDGGEPKAKPKPRSSRMFSSPPRDKNAVSKPSAYVFSSSPSAFASSVAIITAEVSADSKKSSRPPSATLNRHKRPSSAQASNRVVHATEWVNPWGQPDLEALRIEQDIAISKYKLKHDDYSKEQHSPRLLTEGARLDQKLDKSITRRERIIPNTTGKIVNNEFPFYPFLKEQSLNLPHWSAQTIPADDPDRARPDSKKGRMSQSSFHQAFDYIPSSVFDKISVKHAVPISDMNSLASFGKI